VDIEMSLISAKNVQLSFEKKIILDHLNFEVGAGEFVGLIGPNGAGKSSLLRVLGGLLKPNDAEIYLTIDKILLSIEKVSAQQRARFIGYLTQHEIPAWPLTVRNLVALGRIPWNDSAMRISHRDKMAIASAMQMTDVEAIQDSVITEISGGELQRVLLARVFAGSPTLIIADEPIVSLDLFHQLQVMELLQSHARTGGAVIAALHDLNLAARFCSRLVLIDKGNLIAEGTPLQVLTQKNLAEVYGISAYVDCREEGVVIIPRTRVKDR
jgi:ABC-type cobalamin/Fe3+-siderophores transport system ATPase subunit